ncbi:MAG: FAD-dependent oxidoreductase, partial [Halobacteria archaeon]|nr:FAD-dependent oxidoreductase [Halobacteria archaeon]
MARPVKKKAEEHGVEFVLDEKVEGWEETAEGAKVLTDGNEFYCDKVLVAVGREPVTDLGLQHVDVRKDQHGF